MKIDDHRGNSLKSWYKFQFGPEVRYSCRNYVAEEGNKTPAFQPEDYEREPQGV